MLDALANVLSRELLAARDVIDDQRAPLAELFSATKVSRKLEDKTKHFTRTRVTTGNGDLKALRSRFVKQGKT